MPLKILYMLLTCASFMGLCGFVRDRLDIDDASAPLVASCGILLVLMLAGFIGALRWGWLALQAGGIAAFIWVFILRRRRFSTTVLLFMLAALVFVEVIYRGSYFVGNDTVSHWALAAKYLLREHRFPDAGTDLIYFPTYALGTAVYIYYFCRAAGLGAGQYLAAQMLFSCFALLPLLNHVRKNRAIGLAVGVGAILCLLGPRYFHYSLVVESLLAQMAIGGTCIVWQNRTQSRRAVAALLPVMAAMIWVKSSGIFFSLLLCILLVIALRRETGKKAALRALIISLAVIAAVFVLWQVHFKLAYGDTFTGKHSVSLKNYSSTMSQKSAALIKSIASQMLARIFSLKPHVLCLVMYVFTLALAWLSKDSRNLWLTRWRHATVLSFSVLAVWYLMLFVMYVFSMPDYEAVYLAAINRYEYSGILYAAGVMVIFLLEYISDREWKLSVRWRGACACGLTVAIGAALFLTVHGIPTKDNMYGSADTVLNYAFGRDLREKYGVEEGKRYMYFGHYTEYMWMLQCHTTKYEFYSNELLGIFHGDELIAEGGTSDYAYCRSLRYSEKKKGFIDDISAFLAENIDQYDYLLVYDYDPDFDAVLQDFLKDYQGNTQICLSY